MEIDRLLLDLGEEVADREWQLLAVLYGRALQPTYDLVRGFEGSRDGDSAQLIAVRHLFGRSLSDLLAAGHLATHRYVPQTYALLRVVIDSCDLIHLFAMDATQAEVWLSTNEAHKEFAPGRVRKRLGRRPYDQTHGLLSELGSHPRSSGVRMSIALEARDKPDVTSSPFAIGAAPMWHPSTLLAWRFAFDMAFRLAETSSELAPVSADPDATFHAWLGGQLLCLDAVRSGTVLVLRKLQQDFASVDADYAAASERLRALLTS